MTELNPGPVVSVAIPCRNEEANIREIAAAVIAQLESIGVSFEIIFIDNQSSDATVALARVLCAQDSRIKLIVNTRNFGQMRSPTHAIFAGSGQAVIGMCADFQDPPELLPRFIERWRAGVPIVLGVREPEATGFSKGLFRKLFYAFTARVGEHSIIPDATGFGLYDRKVVDAIAVLNEPEPFFRGLLVETGFAIETISYARPSRAGGRSNNNFFVLLDFALSGLASSSKRLLRLPFLVGVVTGVLSALSLLSAVIIAVFGGIAWPWVVAGAIEGQFALLFLVLGLIGDQVRINSERMRGTPLVIERERLNFEER